MNTPSSTRMPALFIGHGSPMLAIESNPFTPRWHQAAQKIPRPRAVVCISAHWESEDSADTAAAEPGLIYDFYGFPPALYQVQYPVAGSPALAAQLAQVLDDAGLRQDGQRGLDHGTWAVLKHMYPQADVPVVQLSLNRNLSPQQHIALARGLQPLRDEGVLILGSGNLVHNLRLLDWQHMHEADFGFDWARRAQTRLLDLIRRRDLAALADYAALGDDVRRAIPTPEHFLPLLYVLALQQDDEDAHIFNTEFVGGSLDMTCVQIGV